MSTRRLLDPAQKIHQLEQRIRDLEARQGRVGGGAWQTPTLLNSWVNYGGAFADAAYRSEPGGVVRLRGLVKDGTAAAVIFTLPAAFRPANTLVFIVPGRTSGGTFDSARIDVQSDGDVIGSTSAAITPGGTGAWLSLSDITFHADG